MTWDGMVSGWGTHVHSWLIHVNVWQNPLHYCNYPPNKINFFLKKKIYPKNYKGKKKIPFWLLHLKLGNLWPQCVVQI